MIIETTKMDNKQFANDFKQFWERPFEVDKEVLPQQYALDELVG